MKTSVEHNYLTDFHLAGFTYYQGIEVYGKLRPGTGLSMKAEPDNPYDARAVALYYKDKKSGLVPRSENRMISKLLNLGHTGLFEAYINRISPDETPENQIGVVVKIKERQT
ncbi:MAG: HIRAN domain-containing protein [Cytophagales bacterium]|nr:HIRAN domain-containing protein [Cytophagales bacterium]